MIEILAQHDITVTIPTVVISSILGVVGKMIYDKRRNGKKQEQCPAPGGKYVTEEVCRVQHRALETSIGEVKDNVKEVRKSQATTNISLAELAILIKQQGRSSSSD